MRPQLQRCTTPPPPEPAAAFSAAQGGSLSDGRLGSETAARKRYGNVNFKDLQLSAEDEEDDEDALGSSPGAVSLSYCV